MQTFTEVVKQPDADHHRVILDALVWFNRAHGPSTASLPLAFLIRDQTGVPAGGLWGHTIYDWLVVQLLVVPEEMRGAGLGSRVLGEAEAAARARGCVGAWLDTYSFQARGFFERLGYRLVGTIEDHPVGGARYILAKKFDAARANAGANSVGASG